MSNQVILSKADLYRLARAVPADRPPPIRAYEIGLRVIAQFLGRDWLTRHFGEDDGALQKLPETDSDPMRGKHITQVIVLAEMLVNLQFKAGVEHCLAQLQVEEFALGYAGLEIGRMLFACQMDFRYGDDPCTLEMRLPDGAMVAVNAHAKVAEDAAPSAALVHDLLATAALRPPAEEPNFIFLQFPASWTLDWLALLDEGAAAFLAAADGRVASVKAYATAWTGPAHELTFAIKEYDHAASSFARPAGWTVFTQPRSIRWRYLRGV